jgi:hypothetical protein
MQQQQHRRRRRQQQRQCNSSAVVPTQLHMPAQLTQQTGGISAASNCHNSHNRGCGPQRNIAQHDTASPFLLSLPLFTHHTSHISLTHRMRSVLQQNPPPAVAHQRARTNTPHTVDDMQKPLTCTHCCLLLLQHTVCDTARTSHHTPHITHSHTSVLVLLTRCCNDAPHNASAAAVANASVSRKHRQCMRYLRALEPLNLFVDNSNNTNTNTNKQPLY